MNTSEFIIPESGSSLEVLMMLFPDSSKNTIKGWVKNKRVLINGSAVKKLSAFAKKGETLSLCSKSKPIDLNIKILYEDKDLVVIHKPEGVLSVATLFEKDLTAHSILKKRYYKQRVYPVHRLDRETSGVMVFAYSDKAKEGLKEQFKKHTISRKYFAVVEGQMKEKSGVWKSFLKEDSSYYVRSHATGAPAITHFKVVKVTGSYSYISLRLETGKKNQVRVHAQDAGHPIVGDHKYGANSNPFNRLGLHAHLLTFFHPTKNKKMVFKSKLPTSFQFRGLDENNH